MRTLLCAIAVALLGHAAADANDLVPTGTLRATFIANNPVQAVTNAKSGEVSGPAAPSRPLRGAIISISVNGDLSQCFN